MFGSKLDLLIRLFDTTTGATVGEKTIRFARNGIPVKPEPRDPGTYLFINTGREDFLMRIEVSGYEIYEAEVRYEELDDRIPECDVFLMPSENTSKGEKVLSFSGTLPFLKKIEAICLTKPICGTNEFSSKTNVLSVFTNAGGRSGLETGSYGILHTDNNSYEKIEVEQNVSLQSVRLKTPIQEELASNQPIMRVIYGYAYKDGRYLLRVRDDGQAQKYLVRYEVGDEVRFQELDFFDQEALK